MSAKPTFSARNNFEEVCVNTRERHKYQESCTPEFIRTRWHLCTFSESLHSSTGTQAWCPVSHKALKTQSIINLVPGEIPLACTSSVIT